MRWGRGVREWEDETERGCEGGGLGVEWGWSKRGMVVKEEGSERGNDGEWGEDWGGRGQGGEEEKSVKEKAKGREDEMEENKKLKELKEEREGSGGEGVRRGGCDGGGCEGAGGKEVEESERGWAKMIMMVIGNLMMLATLMKRKRRRI